MASGPITSWQVYGETMETVRDFIFLGSKITAECDCSHEIKRCLLLGRKVMTNLVKHRESRWWEKYQPTTSDMLMIPHEKDGLELNIQKTKIMHVVPLLHGK